MNEAPGEALLRQLAKRAADRDLQNEEHEDAIESRPLEPAHPPLDDAARARIVQHLETMLLEERKAAGPEGVVPKIDSGTEEQGKSGAKGRSDLVRWLLPMAALLLIFLSVLVYRGQLFSGGGTSTAAVLPNYSLSVEGAARTQRNGEAFPDAATGTGTGPIRLTQGNRLRVTLTPERPAESPLSAYASILDEGGERTLDSALVQVSDRGAVRLDALLGSELKVTGNSARLLVVVGAEGALPSVARAAEASEETGRTSSEDWGKGWRAFSLALEIVELP